MLEQRRFAFHFLGGDADPVDTALGSYLNADGGYGHALDPDLRGPLSQPLHTAHALRVLDSLGRCAGQRIERLCRHLTGVSTVDGALPVVFPAARDYPAAPYHPTHDDPPGELLATGPVVGVLHRNRVWHAWLFRATDFCWDRVETLHHSHPYEVQSAVAFLDGIPDRARAAAAADRLGRLVREQRLVVLDPVRRAEYPRLPATRRASGCTRTTSPGGRNPWPAAGSPTRRCAAPWTSWLPSSSRTAAGRCAGGPGRRGARWSGGRSPPWRPCSPCGPTGA